MKVLITGTARGIGRACALKYLAEGHEVFGFDIRESTILADRYTHLIADITKELPDISGVQVLVNNAGIQLDGDETDGGLRGKEIDVNLKGTIAVTEKYGVTPDIRAIVFMASSSASNGAEFPFYVASKGGIVAYMKNVALRIAKHGAVCNSISAGGVLTELNQHIIDDPVLMKQCLNETLLHKWAQAEEIVQGWVFLALPRPGEQELYDMIAFQYDRLQWADGEGYVDFCGLVPVLRGAEAPLACQLVFWTLLGSMPR